MSVDARIETVVKYMKDHFSSFRYVDVGCFYNGPYNARKLTKVVWVEFASVDTAQNFDKKVVESFIRLENGGKQMLVKPARTEMQKTRNYAVNEAKQLITNAPEPNGKSVEIDFGKYQNHNLVTSKLMVMWLSCKQKTMQKDISQHHLLD